MTDTPADTETTQENRSRLLTKAYGAATARLRAENKDRFEVLYVEEAAQLGIEYTPRRSPQEKAEVMVRAMLNEYPDLRQRIVAEKV